MATSIIDYVFRVLGLEYLGRTDLTQVPPELEEAVAGGLIRLRGRTHAESDRSQQWRSQRASNAQRPGRHAVRLGTATAAMAMLPTQPRMFESTAAVSVMSAHLSEMMGDAPFCDVCGHITVRNGACYKCLNCGNSLGCS